MTQTVEWNEGHKRYSFMKKDTRTITNQLQQASTILSD